MLPWRVCSWWVRRDTLSRRILYLSKFSKVYCGNEKNWILGMWWKLEIKGMLSSTIISYPTGIWNDLDNPNSITQVLITPTRSAFWLLPEFLKLRLIVDLLLNLLLLSLLDSVVAGCCTGEEVGSEWLLLVVLLYKLTIINYSHDDGIYWKHGGWIGLITSHSHRSIPMFNFSDHYWSAPLSSQDSMKNSGRGIHWNQIMTSICCCERKSGLPGNCC